MSRYFLAALLLSSCADYTDFSGTYVGDAEVTYRLKGGASVKITIPQDAVIVKMVRRHYQYSELDITVRDCVVHTSGGEMSWSFAAERGESTCSFDIPSIGPVVIAASGGIERRPKSTTSKAEEVHFMFHGTSDQVESFIYVIDAKPKK